MGNMNEIEDSTLDEMENYCIARFQKKFFIKNNSAISKSAFLKLQEIKNKTSIQIVSDCFERREARNEKLSFFVEIPCKSCDGIIEKTFSKTEFMNALSNKKGFECDTCKKIREREELKAKLESEKANREVRIKNTHTFIENYLTPGYSWNDTVPPSKYFSKLTSAANNIFDGDVRDFICNNLSYKQFLTTPYWKAVAQKKKQQANYCCELCNSQGFLNVHHRTYENHGLEMYHLKDLIVLCNNCHKKFHDIVD